jgi:Fe-S cluster assembly protein SufB
MAQRLDIDPHGSYEERWGWRTPETYVFEPKKGLSREVVEEISFMKSEPEWMRNFRLKAYDRWERRPIPTWGADLSGIDFDNIYYYLKATERSERSWDDVPANVKQTFERLGIPEAEQKYLGGVSAQFECLRGSTRVWTTKGMRLIKELEAGAEVFSLDEETKRIVVSRVVNAASSGDKLIFEITAGGRTIGASANHPFLTLRDERKPGRRRSRFSARWVPVEELRAGDLVAVATDAPEFGRPHELLLHREAVQQGFPQFTTDDLAWFAGLYLGDGSLKHSRRYMAVQIAVDRSDEVLVAEICRVGRETFGLDFSLAGDGFRLTARGTQALADFIELNQLGGTAREKRVPDWVYRLPSSQRLAFLAGYIDADGYVRTHPKNHDVVITSANEELLGDIKELAVLCGITSSRVVSFRQKNPFKPGETVTHYRLFLSGRFDRIPVRSARRAERMGARRWFHDQTASGGTTIRAHTSEMLGFVKIDSIVPVDIETTYDIEVEGHHNFVAEGFIVHNSESVYHSVKEEIAKQGVLFADMDTAVREYPDIVQKYISTIIPINDNKLAALNSAVWSGGSFIYVPPGVKVDIPLQAYFRINAENAGQFERTLIIADEGSYVHYVEGCTAPTYSSNSLHSAVVELIAHKNARLRYTTIQNWSPNVYNLVTKRAVAEENAIVEWVDGNIGSRVTMKYPAVVLKGRKAHGETLSLAFAGAGQHQDTGSKMTHVAPETTSQIISKSISKGGGRTSYRGGVWIHPGAKKAKSNVVCDALLIDEESRSDTYPYMDVQEDDVEMGHEATVARIGDEQLFYLQSRGIPQAEAASMIVRGFIEPITKQLPMEYAVELNRLIELEMEGSVG